MSLGCVVVSYRTNDDLNAFITSWLAFRPIDIASKLIVVDVHPTVEWEGMLDQRLAADVMYLPIDSNVGYARACNLAARHFDADVDVLAFFNADVVLKEGALAACYAALTQNPTWAVLGPRQVDERGRLTAGGIVGTEATPQHRGWMEPDKGQHTGVEFVPTVAGSAYFIKRRMWDELTKCPLFQAVAPEAEGAFLPVFHYYNETYLSYHARAHGYDVVFYGPVTIVHKWHRASPQGGIGEQSMPADRDYFRRACRAHNIDHD